MIFCRDTEEESIFESKSMNHLTHLWRFTTVIIQNCNLKKFFYYRHKLLPCQYNILHMFFKTYFLIFLNFLEYQIYFICVGAGLGLLVLIFIVCCCLKNGKSKLKRANKNSVHGVTNRAMVNVFLF